MALKYTLLEANAYMRKFFENYIKAKNCFKKRKEVERRM